MKAAVFIKPNSPLEIQDVPIPQPGDRDILIKVSAASLCHSDFMVLDGTYPVSAPGTILGHEACGTITAVGPIAEKRGFKIGERVGSVCWYGMCMDCHACTNYGPQYCANKKMMGFVVNGFFAEYALLDVESAVKVPEGADMASLAPVFCAGVTVWDGLNQISAPKGSWIAYVGCGGLGMHCDI
jgi:alcohol dehydrogenase, propanol-preferring